MLYSRIGYRELSGLHASEESYSTLSYSSNRGHLTDRSVSYVFVSLPIIATVCRAVPFRRTTSTGFYLQLGTRLRSAQLPGRQNGTFNFPGTVA